MPTQEFEDLVSAIAETIEQVLPTDQLMPADSDQTTSAGFAGGPVDAFVVDYEKVIWHYPDAVSRLIEEIA
jgi:hypothetical protein